MTFLHGNEWHSLFGQVNELSLVMSEKNGINILYLTIKPKYCLISFTVLGLLIFYIAFCLT